MDHESELRRLLNDRQVVVIAGAGVSIRAVDGQKIDNHDVASWPGLLRHGIDTASGVDDQWRELRRGQVARNDTEELISAAELITSAMGGRRSGTYGRWLTDTVGALRATQTDVIEALLTLGAPIATTNYDNLIEDVAGRDLFYTWEDGSSWQKVLRGREEAVLHLHGHFRRPNGVILGLRSYDEVTADGPAQAMLEALAQTTTFLLVGMGAGLEDPNFGALRAWLRTVAGDSQFPHYRLVARGEKIEHDTQDPFTPVTYGDGFDDLAPFLLGIAPEPVRAQAAENKPRILELTIGRSQVVATPRPSGKPKTVDLHLDEMRVSMLQLLEDWLRRRDDPEDEGAGPGPVPETETEPEEAKLLGRILYDAVFHGAVKRLFEEELADVRNPGGPERLALVLKVSRERAASLDGGLGIDLTELPWELLSSPEEGWLAQNPSLTLFRALYGDPPPVEADPAELRLCVIKAQPKDVLEAARDKWNQPKADLYDLAMDEMTKHLASLGNTHAVVKDVDVLEHPTFTKVQRALGGPNPPNIIHYVGYDSVDAGQRRWVALEREDGQAAWEPSDRFANLFRPTRPKIVFLHLCEGPRDGDPARGIDFARASFTELAVLLLNRGVQLVVAMQYPISPDIGLDFTRQFYDGIQNPGDAVHDARQQAKTFYRLGAAVLYLHDASLVTVNGKRTHRKAATKDNRTVSRRDEAVRPSTGDNDEAQTSTRTAAPALHAEAATASVLPGLSADRLKLKAYEVAKRANHDTDRFMELSEGLYVELRGNLDGTIEPVTAAVAARRRAGEARPGELPALWEQLSAELEPRPEASGELWR